MYLNVREQQIQSGLKLLNFILNVQNFMYAVVLIEALVNPKENWGLMTPLSFIIVNFIIQNCMSNDPSWLPLVPLILTCINTVLTLEWELSEKSDSIYMLPST